MGELARRAVEDWKTADAAAKEAEDRLKAAWTIYYERKGRAPAADLIGDVSRLRKVANEKLAAAIALSHPDAKPPQGR